MAVTREAMAAVHKMIAACEAFAAAHPGEAKAYSALNAAYINATTIDDNTIPRADYYQRNIALLGKAIAADEALIALEPGNLRYHWSLAETRANLAESFYNTGEYARAIELYRQAAAVTREKAGDPNDANARWVNTLVHLGLASTLVKTGGFDEAGVLFANAEKSLLAMEKSADSLPVQFYLALAGIRGGERYVALAANPRLSASEELSHWRKARDSLSPGVVRLKKVGESVVLTGCEQRTAGRGRREPRKGRGGGRPIREVVMSCCACRPDGHSYIWREGVRSAPTDRHAAAHATSPGYAQVDPCVPSLNPMALERVDVETQRCGLRLHSYLRESGGELSGTVTIGIDDHNAIRIVQNSAEPPFALLQTGDVIGAVRDATETLSIGESGTRKGRSASPKTAWMNHVGSRSAMPYVAGVPSRSLPLPDGGMRYSLIGAPFMISGSNNVYAPVANADGRSRRIEPAPISGADLNVDFVARTARLNLRFNVRGVPGEAVIDLKQLKPPSLTFEEVDCGGAAPCATASLNFYGRDANFAGVLLTVYYDRVMPQADRVAAQLTNVFGQAAIALQRR